MIEFPGSMSKTAFRAAIEFEAQCLSARYWEGDRQAEPIVPALTTSTLGGAADNKEFQLIEHDDIRVGTGGPLKFVAAMYAVDISTEEIYEMVTAEEDCGAADDISSGWQKLIRKSHLRRLSLSSPLFPPKEGSTQRRTSAELAEEYAEELLGANADHSSRQWKRVHFLMQCQLEQNLLTVLRDINKPTKETEKLVQEKYGARSPKQKARASTVSREHDGSMEELVRKMDRLKLDAKPKRLGKWKPVERPSGILSGDHWNLGLKEMVWVPRRRRGKKKRREETIEEWQESMQKKIEEKFGKARAPKAA